MKQEYSAGENVKNVFNLLYTKLMYKGARLIRRPFYVRGKKHIEFKPGITVGYYCRFEAYALPIDKPKQKKLIIGARCKFGDRVHLSACEQVAIGDDCLFASNILVSDNQHGFYNGTNQTNPLSIPDERELNICKVDIGNRCWIGENVVILSGSELGNGCVVGANSVVNGQFPDNVIIAGSPAKIIKEYKQEKGVWERENGFDL